MKRLLLTISLTVALAAGAVMAQQSTGTLKGQVLDELGGTIVGALVAVTDASGQVKTVTTNNEGLFVINGLQIGKYKVAAAATGFAAYEDPAVEILAGRTQQLNITLKVMIEEQKVTMTISSNTIRTATSIRISSSSTLRKP